MWRKGIEEEAKERWEVTSGRVWKEGRKEGREREREERDDAQTAVCFFLYE